MNYNQAIEYLRSTQKFGMKLGLERIKELLGLMGNPQDKLRVIHVAGTNGKGSTCNYIANILQTAGYKVGLYISPYVENFCERIQVDGYYISKGSVENYVSLVKTYADKMNKDDYPTEFELITAMAFKYFVDCECDFVILEVGLGGSYDATNAVKKPLVSVITSISFDHMEHLGNTIAQIAENKCGIIKEWCPVVCWGGQPTQAISVVKKHAAEKRCDLTFTDMPTIEEASMYGTIFNYKRHRRLHISMLGQHQAQNASIAIEAIEMLNIKNYVIVSKEQIAEGLAKTNFAGRFEIISQSPLVIRDGAHNYAGMAAFCESAKKYLKGQKVGVVLGMLADKEVEKCTREVAKAAHIIITTTVDNPRAMPAPDLSKIALKYLTDVFTIENKLDAVQKAIELAGDNGAVCICGSLFLIGGINAAFVEK